MHGARGGYYTSDEYRRIVTFAASRGITVVPEVDVPGHVNAALHAYGELTPSGEPAETYTGIEVGISRLDAGLPATRPFLRDVFADVAAMTPGPYVHIGGDEAMSTPHGAYLRFQRRLLPLVRKYGKIPVGWHEIAQSPAAVETGAVIQFWGRERNSPTVAATGGIRYGR